MNAAPVPVTAGGKYSFSGPREGRSLVHSTIEGYLEWSVDWKMRENDITSSGIEPKYTLAAIIVNPENRVFNMVVRTKSTTFANVPVKGRKRIQSTSPRLQVKGRLDREAWSPTASEITPPSRPMWSGT
ncbi:MAG: hypothetical protein FRX48_02280 [Lasallia pustulata]|uniref:Uncharacterized protein n=1 Tax=Lasallia pustulata TaxID=136370 RepID=A0A5M8PYW6_9LECA|nr:MAG: hypothetical protein FRX48_02280 [Lasallia pustulata]